MTTQGWMCWDGLQLFFHSLKFPSCQRKTDAPDLFPTVKEGIPVKRQLGEMPEKDSKQSKLGLQRQKNPPQKLPPLASTLCINQL